jgi:hypothetical protein
MLNLFPNGHDVKDSDNFMKIENQQEQQWGWWH